MNLQYRIDLLVRLGDYILSGDEKWEAAKEKAGAVNPWFTPEFIELSANNISRKYLNREELERWTGAYDFRHVTEKKWVGIVMAGNIPLVGFHDLLCVFISGHKSMIKTSSKDEVLIKHLAGKLIEWEPLLENDITFNTMLKGCDAYIATGSNNSARYFEYYFAKYPHIIRKHRTSVAILTGDESAEELEKLSDDVYQYFGLGCRNVTKIFVPEHYDFIPLLNAFRKYDYLADHNKYKNNYDYNLAVYILNKQFYMSNDSILLIESPSLFSPISQLNYSFYNSQDDLEAQLQPTESLQCIVGRQFVPFGRAQVPALDDYADGVDTIGFLQTL
jgi:hypothetical protein